MAKTVTGMTWKGYEGQDYEQFWTGPGRHYLDEREHWIISNALPGGDSVVEIGAGFGRLGNCYVDKYKNVHMVEPASNLREIARRTYGSRVQYHDASVYDLPFSDNSFDAVVMVRVFHHLAEPEKALRELHRIIKPGGRLVFNFSNKRNLKRIAQFAVRRARNPFSQDMEEYLEGLIGHHPKHVDAMLRNLGFEIVNRYGAGLADKVVEKMPAARRVLEPTGRRFFDSSALSLSPLHYLVAMKRST